MTPTPPAALSPGDLIRSPGGAAVVTDVDASRLLVRVAYRDGTGPAFVYLARNKLVVRLDSTPG